MRMRWPVGVLTVLLMVACGNPPRLFVETIHYDATTHQAQLSALPAQDLQPSGRPGDVAGLGGLSALNGYYVVVRQGGRVGTNVCGPDPATTREEARHAAVVDEPETVNISYNIFYADVDDDGAVDQLAVPADHDSLVMASAYVVLNDVTRALREMGDTSHATGTRAVVAYDAETVIGCAPEGLGGVGLSSPEWDNAAYDSDADMMMLLRNLAPGTPAEFAVHPGVLAHEYGHRVFDANVYATDEQFARRAEAQAAGGSFCAEPPGDGQDDCRMQDYLQSGMDEGTADVLAWLYTSDPDFGARVSLGGERALNTAPDLSSGYAIYGSQVLKDAHPDTTSEEASFYWLGSLWSRAFFASVVDPDSGQAPASQQARVEIARRLHAPALMAALRRTGNDLLGNTLFVPQWFIRRFLEELARVAQTPAQQMQLGNAACAAMCERFGERPVPVTPGAPLPQCAGTTGHNEQAESHAGGAFPCTL